MQDGIPVGHEQQRGVVLRAEGADQGEDLRQVDAGVQRADAGKLDHAAIGHRIGEGHAQFDDIRAPRRHRAQGGQPALGIRIAPHQISHQRALLAGAALGKTVGNTAHMVLRKNNGYSGMQDSGFK